MNIKSEQILKISVRLSEEELTRNILPYWMARMPDHRNGGFFGRIDGKDRLIPEAPRGAILNARILWAFSSAYTNLRNAEYLETAERAYDYILSRFFDEVNGGTYWSLTSGGDPLDTKKQIYSQAFFVYALSEYFLASANENARIMAIELFRIIEEYSFDKKLNGYFEAFDKGWSLLDDLRLSEKDANEMKTMNTHLHILEAYTNLYRIWPDEFLKGKLRNLINLFLNKIIDNKSWHLNLFFDETWNCRSTLISYGHDIEASWLIYEAAREINNKDLLITVKDASLRIIRAVMEGIQDDGSLIYEADSSTGHIDKDRHWWVQAEAVVGFLNAFELTGDIDYLKLSEDCLAYIKKNLVDAMNGEWFWSIRSDGTVNRTDDKAGFWKCPYHNSRMCLEIIRRGRTISEMMIGSSFFS
jgi:mannobiose 2-epimerase